MVGPSEISAVFTAIKSAKDILEAMVGLRDANAFQTQKVELLSKLVDVQVTTSAIQEERAATIEKIARLEAEVARLKSWDAVKKHYKLQRWGDGAFAYVLREECADSEPIHALCPNCFQAGRRSILQANGAATIREQSWDCPACKMNVFAHSRVLQSALSGR